MERQMTAVDVQAYLRDVKDHSSSRRRFGTWADAGRD